LKRSCCHPALGYGLLPFGENGQVTATTNERMTDDNGISLRGFVAS
jgi:hypothetical protein